MTVTTLWLALSLSTLPQEPDLTVGQPLYGAVVDGDERVVTPTLRENESVPTLGRTYRLRVEAAGTYSIDLRALDFDAYLVVRSEDGELLVEDDDALGSGDSQVALRLETGDTYIVQACALHGNRGEFELLVRLGGPRDLEPRARMERLLGDAQRWVDRTRAVHGADHLLHAAALERLGASLYGAAHYGEAIARLEDALAIREASDVVTAEELTANFLNLAAVCLEIERLEEARTHYRRALETGAEQLGEEHPYVLMGRRGLGRALELLGDFSSALRAYEQNLAARERVHGPNHPETARTLNFLGTAQRKLGDYGASRVSHERALAIFEATVGRTHIDWARTMSNLGIVFFETAEASLAVRCFEESLAVYEATFGPRHPETAYLLGNLGNALHSSGDYERAMEYQSRALEIRERVLGPRHPLTARALQSRGGLLLELGRYDEARRAFDGALESFRSALGEDHPETARALLNRAFVLWELGSFEEALGAGEHALEACQKAFGREHPTTASAFHNLGAMVREKGDLARASSLFRRAIELSEASLGGTNRRSALSRLQLADCLRLSGRNDLALAEYEVALDLFEEVYGPNHPATANARFNRSAALLEAGDPDGAIRAGLEAQACIEAAYGSGHPDSADALHWVAALMTVAGRNEEAWELLSRAAPTRDAFRAHALAAMTEREQYAFLQSARWQLDLRLALALESGEQAHLRQAFSELLVWKGWVARELATEFERLRASDSPLVRRRFEELAAVQSELSNLLAGTAAPLVDTPEARLTHLVERRKALELELHRLVETKRVPVTSAASSAELARALPEYGVLLCYVAHLDLLERAPDSARIDGDRIVSAWVLLPDGVVEARRLGGVDPSIRAAEAFTASLRREPLPTRGERGVAVAAASSTPSRENDSARRFFWDPVADLVQDADLVLVTPDGALGSIPLGALRSKERYLLEERAFVVLQDPLELLRLPTLPESRSGDLLVVGGVDFGEPTAPGAWEFLAGTRSEAEAVLRTHEELFGGSRRELLAGDSATEESLKEELPGYEHLHLATHGFFHSELPDLLADLDPTETGPAPTLVPQRSRAELLFLMHPGLLSGLVCAGANESDGARGNDGLLTAEEVSWIDLSRAHLVVLSACESGLGQVEMGEGMIGLRRSFRVAGARAVISSLWSIPDAATDRIMQDFYRNLWEDGLTRIEALRHAQLAELERNREQFGIGLPHTWGAFVLDGDWR